jgi:hypothetical protein
MTDPARRTTDTDVDHPGCGPDAGRVCVDAHTLNPDGRRPPGARRQHRPVVDPLLELTAALRADARGSYKAEASVESLVAQAGRVARPDLVAPIRVVDAWAGDSHLGDGHLAGVDWDGVIGTDLPAPADDSRIVRLAGELAGWDSGRTLAELVVGFAETVTLLLLGAVAHTRPAWRHTTIPVPR